MPEVQYAHPVAAPLDAVWDFVGDMDNWGPFLTGYQSHEKIDDRTSVWIVKGELGGMTRTAKFKVHILEWQPPEAVIFELEGLSENVNGSGRFSAISEAPPNRDAASPLESAVINTSWWQRLTEQVAKLLYRSLFGRAVPVSTPTNPQMAEPGSILTFSLSLSAGGATGPVLNLLLGPMLCPVAEDLAKRIAASVESRRLQERGQAVMQ